MKSKKQFLVAGVIFACLSALTACYQVDGLSVDSAACENAVRCQGQCINPLTDRDNCGSCGEICGANQACENGSCQGLCGGGSVACGGECVKLQTDPFNCGQCGIACQQDLRCVKGECSLTCADGTMACGSSCVDRKVDSKNCGECGVVCKNGELCEAGTCALSCGGGAHACENACVDLDNDPMNCGTCAKHCSTGSHCDHGFCASPCPIAMTLCATACVDKLTDLQNCGQCGKLCDATQECALGICKAKPTNSFMCNRKVIAVNTEYGRTLLIEDLNGDKQADFVLTRDLSKELRVVLAPSSGALSSQYAISGEIFDAVPVDLNHDGYVDLAVSAATGEVQVLLNNGAGLFPSGLTYNFGGSPAVESGDLNGDGSKDLIIYPQNQSQFMIVQSGKPSPTVIGPIQSSVSSRTPLIRDTNADGRADIVFCGTSVEVLLNDGKGGFVETQPRKLDSLSFRSCLLTDSNSDGKFDVILATDSSIEIHTQNAKGDFQLAYTYKVSDRIQALALSDLNGDGHDDVIASRGNNESSYEPHPIRGIDVLLHDGKDSLLPPSNLPQNAPFVFVVADLDNDNRPEIIINNGESLHQVLPNLGDGTFPWVSFTRWPARKPTDLQLADLNADGWLDIAALDKLEGMYVWLNDGQGKFPNRSTYDYGGSDNKAMAMGDFNNDGKLDVVVAAVDVGALIWLNNGDGTFLGPPLPVKSANYSYPFLTLFPADYDVNGTVDIAADRNIYYNNGNSIFSESPNLGLLKASGDLNGDGYPDLFVGDAYLFNDGKGNFTPVVANFGGISKASLGDLNGDGVLDIVFSQPQVGVSFGTGNGQFSQPLYTKLKAQDFEVELKLRLAQLNGTAGPDLYYGNSFVNSLTVAEDLESQPFKEAKILALMTRSAAVGAGDFDNDGTADIVSLSYLGMEIRYGRCHK